MSILGFVRLIRPINSVMMGSAVLVGELIASGGVLGAWEVLLGFSVGFLLTGGTMAVNDYYDLEIDLVNEPERPIPSGQVSRSGAFWIGVVLALLGVILSGLTGPQSLAIASLAAALMIYYNTVGKKTGFLGNVVVSLCVSLPFIYGGVVVGRPIMVLAFFSMMAFMSNLGREVVKGIVDLDGDREAGVETVASSYGTGGASRLSAFFYLAAVLLSSAPLLLDLVSPLYIPLVAAAGGGFTWSSISILRDSSSWNARRVKNRTLVWMLLGMLAFIMGSLTL